jgi:hypothetical protein
MLQLLTYHRGDDFVSTSRFDASKMTRILVHGFANDGFEPWVQDMKNAFLQRVCLCHVCQMYSEHDHDI